MHELVPGTAGSNPTGLYVHDGLLYFGRNDATGTMHKTDGMNAATLSLPAPFASSNKINSFVVAGGKLHAFSDRAGVWSVAGDNVSTVVDPKNSSVTYFFDATADKILLKRSTDNLVAIEAATGGVTHFTGTTGELVELEAGEDEFYFPMSSQDSGIELWKTDGSIDGTVLVRNIRDDVGTQSSTPGRIAFAGEHAFFIATGPQGSALYSYNLTNKTVSLITAPQHGTYVVYNRKAYFFKSGTLWESDGTPAGTKATSLTMPDSSYVVDVNPQGRLLVLSPQNSSNQRLWATDSNQANPVMVAENLGTVKARWLGDIPIVATGSAGIQVRAFTGSEVRLLMSDTNFSTQFWQFNAVTATHVFFTVYKGSTSTYHLLATDGTEEGTILLDSAPSWDRYQRFQLLGNELFFAGSGPSGTQRSFWRSNGTAEGTFRIKTAVPPLEGFGTLAVFRGQVYLSTQEASGVGPPYYLALWKVDENHNAVRVQIPQLSGTISLVPVQSDDLLYFVNGTNLFGYVPGQNQLDFITNNTGRGSDDTEMTRLGVWIESLGFHYYGGTLFFNAFREEFGLEPWAFEEHPYAEPAIASGWGIQ